MLDFLHIKNLNSFLSFSKFVLDFTTEHIFQTRAIILVKFIQIPICEISCLKMCFLFTDLKGENKYLLLIKFYIIPLRFSLNDVKNVGGSRSEQNLFRGAGVKKGLVWNHCPKDNHLSFIKFTLPWLHVVSKTSRKL